MLTESTVHANQVDLNVAATGADGAPPLVLLHGVTRCWQDFMTLIPSLATRYQIYALDFRGHGTSGHGPGSYLVSDYVRDALSLVRGYIGRPAVVYGHSLGAMVAAAVAADAPDLVSALVMEDPPFETLGSQIRYTTFYDYFVSLADLTQRRLKFDELARELANVRVVTQTGDLVLLGDVRDATSLRFHAKCLHRMDPDVLTPLIEGRWLEGYDRSAILSRIQPPVLLLEGEYSSGGMMPAGMGDEVVATVPDCTRVVVRGVGHQLHAMAPDTTLRLTHNFLESLR